MPRNDVIVHRASSLTLDPVPDLCIQSFQEIHNGTTANFAADAEKIVDALFTSLPGGTLDHVIILMLQRKASQLLTRYR